jgi:nucleotide-binding universal stress UspA family protein
MNATGAEQAGLIVVGVDGSKASEGAEPLVVGSRGHGALADMLLGSVSTYCVHHAHCPVTVIRPAGHRTDR